MKKLSFLTLAFCLVVSMSFGQYAVTIEAAPAVADSLGTTYRFYIDLYFSTDQVNAIYGNNQVTLAVDAPSGVFNSPLNASWNASGLNPAFLPTFPELAADTYATIGLEGPASSSGIAGAADPGIVEDGDQPISPFFLTDGATSLLSNTEYGASWYVPNTAANGSPQGNDLRVLVMQVTTAGTLSGQLNYQIAIVGESIYSFFSTFSGAGTFESEPFIQIEGCMDETACNYNPEANFQTVDACEGDVDADGICDDVDDCIGAYDSCGVCNGPGAIYECGCDDIPAGDCDCDGNVLDVVGVCGGTCTVDDDNNGTCDDQEIYGCRYELAENYNPEATRDDDSCIFPCEGAVNINVFDWDEDYAVTVTDFLMMLSVYGDVDVDFDGVWDSGDLCVDTEACNYDVEPSEECAYIDLLGICGGGCESDADNDGICDDVDTCVGIEDECGVCNGPGPTEVVIESITILYDSVYLPQLNEWYVYEFGADTAFAYTCGPSVIACGNSVSYQGYDYATVLIGEQCWFAENLRSENYENGDAIPFFLLDSYWENTTSGAVSIYGEGSFTCNSYSPDIDACNPGQSLNEYGRLYNWYAVEDARGLCPSGWHVPTDGEWTVMTDYLGGGAVAGVQMKTTYGWYDGGNGTNSSGFSGLPGGYRGLDGAFDLAGGSGFWWSSSPVGSEVWGLVSNTNDAVGSFNFGPRHGFSVRCVRDAE